MRPLVTAAWYCLLTSIPLCAAQFVKNELPIGSSFGVPEDAVYDYVVIGGGTAGLVVANRLAQDGRYSVAIVEAGSIYELENGNKSIIPGFNFYSTDADPKGVNPLIDWKFMTAPQEGLDGRKMAYTRGKCLGGTSARNYMVYQRPSRGTLDEWAEVVGDESWKWDNVLPFYKKSTHFTPADMQVRRKNATPTYDASLFGEGPLQVGYARYASPAAPWVLRAFEEAGSVLQKEAFNSGDLLGYAYNTLTINGDRQERSSSASYLWAALQETTQLTVYTHALAKKLLFDGKTVTGAQIDTLGKQWTISAKKEVILSAGAIQSPQLLMVSGVGPMADLQRHGIEVVQDLPGVGRNLQDNLAMGITFAIGTETIMTYLNNPARFAEAINEYNEHRSGWLTSPSSDALTFEKVVGDTQGRYNLSKEAQEALSWLPDDWPELEYAQLAGWMGPKWGSAPPDTKNYATIITALLTPLSRGQVTISSSDMADRPLIDFKWLTHPVDQELAIAGYKRIRQILATKSMQEVADTSHTFPPTSLTADEDILQMLKGQVMTIFHAAATCKMGQRSDPMAVIDSKARVFGVKNLRVVDLSGVPFLPPGQPQATVYMLAEKAAHEILSEVTMVSEGDGSTVRHDEL